MWQNRKTFGFACNNSEPSRAKYISPCPWVTASSSRQWWSAASVSTLTSIYPQKPMLITVPRHVSSTCNVLTSCTVMFTMTHCIFYILYILFVHLYCHVWIVVIVCLPADHSLHSTICSMCKTLLLGFSVVILPRLMRHRS